MVTDNRSLMSSAHQKAFSLATQLPGATVVTVRTTEPALVTLYRATGNSTGWQRFVRRNGIVDPLFIPGGHSVEVISEQQG